MAVGGEGHCEGGLRWEEGEGEGEGVRGTLGRVGRGNMRRIDCWGG